MKIIMRIGRVSKIICVQIMFDILMNYGLDNVTVEGNDGHGVNV